jgi:hypothetical protein
MNISEPFRSAIENRTKGSCKLTDYHRLQVGDKTLRFTFHGSEGTDCNCDVVDNKGNLSDLIGYSIHSLDSELVCTISNKHFSFDATRILEGFEVHDADGAPIETQWSLEPIRFTGAIYS